MIPKTGRRFSDKVMRKKASRMEMAEIEGDPAFESARRFGIIGPRSNA